MPRLLQRLRRGESFTVEERLNEMIDAINTVLAMTVGNGLELKHTPGGMVLSLAPSMRAPREFHCRYRIWIQDTEPEAAEWGQGELWIDTSTTYDTNYHQMWVKLKASDVSNVSKAPLTVLVTS